MILNKRVSDLINGNGPVKSSPNLLSGFHPFRKKKMKLMVRTLSKRKKHVTFSSFFLKLMKVMSLLFQTVITEIHY